MKILNKKAVSVIEYAVLIVIVLGALVVMRNYIQRGAYGKWATAGKAFAFGRQYDPQQTIECGFDQQSNLWYDHNCVSSLSHETCAIGNIDCQEQIIVSSACSSSRCSQLNNGESP